MWTQWSQWLNNLVNCAEFGIKFRNISDQVQFFIKTCKAWFRFCRSNDWYWDRLSCNTWYYNYQCGYYNSDLEAMKEDDRPLRDEEIRKLRVLRPFLVNNICLNGLLNQLLAKGCISRKQFDGIRKQKGNDDKIREMLDILERRNYEHLKMFVSCLKFTHQKQIAQEIESTGG